jgi:hypothetical protein
MPFEINESPKRDLVAELRTVIKRKEQGVNAPYLMDRVEFTAVKKLQTPTEIKDFFDQYVEAMKRGDMGKHSFMALGEKASNEDQAFWQISYALDSEDISTTTRELWSKALGKKLILSSSTKERDRTLIEQ